MQHKQRRPSDIGYKPEPPKLVTIRNVRQYPQEWLEFKQKCRQLEITTHEGVRQALYNWLRHDQ